MRGITYVEEMWVEITASDSPKTVTADLSQGDQALYLHMK